MVVKLVVKLVVEGEVVVADVEMVVVEVLVDVVEVVEVESY